MAVPQLPKAPIGNVAVGSPAPVAPQFGTVAPRVRSEAMEMIARQADDKIREGTNLAERGACFAARANFVAALRILAQGLDNDDGTARHSQALARR